MNAKKTNNGCVYVLSNECMPGIVKIGYSCRSAEERALEIYKASTAAPVEFIVEYQAECSSPREIEAEVHRKLTKVRVNHKREFFRCTVQHAIDAIENILDLDIKEDRDSNLCLELSWRQYGPDINNQLAKTGKPPMNIRQYASAVGFLSEQVDLIISRHLLSQIRKEKFLNRVEKKRNDKADSSQEWF